MKPSNKDYETNKELLGLLKNLLPILQDSSFKEMVDCENMIRIENIIELIPLLFDKFECHDEMAKYVFSSYRKISVADYKLYEYFFADKKESAWILFDYEGVIQDLIKTIKEYYD